jgi:hypothetical protein
MSGKRRPMKYGSAEARREAMGLLGRELQRETVLSRCTPLARQCLLNELARSERAIAEGKRRAAQQTWRERKCA